MQIIDFKSFDNSENSSAPKKAFSTNILMMHNSAHLPPLSINPHVAPESHGLNPNLAQLCRLNSLNSCAEQQKKNAERVREREGASEEEKEREGKTHGSRPRENAKRNASLEVSRNNNKNQKNENRNNNKVQRKVSECGWMGGGVAESGSGRGRGKREGNKKKNNY